MLLADATGSSHQPLPLLLLLPLAKLGATTSPSCGICPAGAKVSGGAVLLCVGEVCLLRSVVACCWIDSGIVVFNAEPLLLVAPISQVELAILVSSSTTAHLTRYCLQRTCSKHVPVTNVPEHAKHASTRSNSARSMQDILIPVFEPQN